MGEFKAAEVMEDGYKYTPTPGNKWKGILRFYLKGTPGEFVLFDWGRLPVPNVGDIIDVEATYDDKRRNYSVQKKLEIVKAAAVEESTAQQVTQQPKALKGGGDYRSPEDFKRTSALAQAVSFMGHVEVTDGAGFDEIIRTTIRVARIFNYFLNTGKTPNLRTGDDNE